MGSPHDLALTAAPLEITGPGERALAVYISETRRTGSSLRKFILLPDGAHASTCTCAPWLVRQKTAPREKHSLLVCFVSGMSFGIACRANRQDAHVQHCILLSDVTNHFAECSGFANVSCFVSGFVTDDAGCACLQC